MQLSFSAQNVRSAALEALFNHLLSPFFFSPHSFLFSYSIFGFSGNFLHCIETIEGGQKNVYTTTTTKKPIRQCIEFTDRTSVTVIFHFRVISSRPLIFCKIKYQHGAKVLKSCRYSFIVKLLP